MWVPTQTVSPGLFGAPLIGPTCGETSGLSFQNETNITEKNKKINITCERTPKNEAATTRPYMRCYRYGGVQNEIVVRTGASTRFARSWVGLPAVEVVLMKILLKNERARSGPRSSKMAVGQ